MGWTRHWARTTGSGSWISEGPERGRAKPVPLGPAGLRGLRSSLHAGQPTFFVAIQHPGSTEKTTYDAPGSRWPDDRPDLPPRPSVVAIYRPDGRKIGE